jgi:hypothetical protein
MADTVGTDVLFNGTRRYIVRLTNISDGTGESAVIKVDKSTLTNGNGTEPGKLILTYAEWSINGFASVRLLFDHTTDDELLLMGTGSGWRNFEKTGGFADPASTGGTGDVLLTTSGASATATYDIYLEFIKGN